MSLPLIAASWMLITQHPAPEQPAGPCAFSVATVR
jgi:hypothetical protein